MAPIQQNVWAAGAKVCGFAGPLANFGAVVAENERLKNQFAELMAAKSRLNLLEEENNTLRQSLNLELHRDFDLKIAQIVGKDAIRDVLIINKGSKDMVEAGMPVLTGQRGLAGKISRVYDNFSEVTLVTSKDFSFDIKIGEQKIDALAKGKGGFKVTADLVPKDKEIKTGDPVYTSAMGGIFPDGLWVGSLAAVDKNDVETFQSAEISPAFDSKCQTLFVASIKYPLGMESGFFKNGKP